MSNHFRIQITKKIPHLECVILQTGGVDHPAERVILFRSLAGVCFEASPILSRRNLKSFRVSDCLSVRGDVVIYSDTIRALYADSWSSIPIEFCE